MNFLRRAFGGLNSAKKDASGEASFGDVAGKTIKSLITKKVLLTIAFPVFVGVLFLFVILFTLTQFDTKIKLMQMVDTSYSDDGYIEGGSSSSSGSTVVGGNNLADAMVNLAVAQMNDYSATNGKKYWSYYGNGSWQPWCAYFVSWVIDNTQFNGQKLSSIIKSQGGACNFCMSQAVADGDYYANDGSYKPQRGDIFWLGSSADRVSCIHVGIVQSYDAATNSFVSIEGNASNSVKENTYYLSTNSGVKGFYHWY